MIALPARNGETALVDVIKGKFQIVREIARSNDIVYEAIDTRSEEHTSELQSQ